MTVHIGFTGTQSGMTEAQQATVHRLLLDLGAGAVHHGDCIGADDEADTIARELGIVIHLHPPTDRTKRAFNVIDVDLYPEKPYLERNRDIIDACEALIAAPKETTETLRSGTWSTVRYARKQGKPVHICWPDGSVSEEKPNGPPSG
jgi:hypothetical protein